MSGLTQGASVLSYNGVTFPTETETLGITTVPQYDQSGRTVVFNVITITVRAILGQANQDAGETVDATMETVRKRLTAPAGQLRYVNKGFGDLNINVPAGQIGGGDNVFDVKFGPRPEELSWRPLGQQAAEIVWRVTVRVPLCDNASYVFALLAFNFTLAVDVDKSGYSKRTFAGYLEVPMTRQGGPDDRTLPDTADNYLERISPPLLPGFRRVRGPATLSADKSRLDFGFTDEEIGPNYPPPGVVEAHASHSVRTDKWWSIQYHGSLRASYELARDTPVERAQEAFMALYRDRVARVIGRPLRGLQNVRGRRAPPCFVMCRQFEGGEPQIYGKPVVSFAVGYDILLTAFDFMTLSGLWRPVPGSDWGRWAASLAGSAFHVRGNARLRFAPAGEQIIDLCLPQQELRGEAMPGGGLRGAPPPGGEAFADLFRAPPPESSWRDYRLLTTLLPRDNTHVMKPLPGAPQQLRRTPEGHALSTQPAQGQSPKPASAPAGIPANQVAMLCRYIPDPEPDVVQVQNDPVWQVVLSGTATRVGYPIAPPALVSYGGARAIPQNRQGDHWTHGPVACWFGNTVYAASWRIRYTLDRQPAGQLVSMDDNPMLGG